MQGSAHTEATDALEMVLGRVADVRGEFGEQAGVGSMDRRGHSAVVTVLVERAVLEGGAVARSLSQA